MLQLKSSLKVFDTAETETIEGVVEGQTRRPLVGSGGGCASERLRMRLASFKVGTHEPLHWHLVEALYYVISGRAIMQDIEGKNYELRPGSVIYAPPGLMGSHSWTVKEELQILSIRASNNFETKFQFTVDKDTKSSSIDLDAIRRHGVDKFQKSLYSK